MLKLIKSIPAAAPQVAGISLPASASDVDSRTIFSTTAQPGFVYSDGQYVKSAVVPQVMRQTDTMTPHSTGDQMSSAAKPGFFYHEGVYRKAP